MNGEVSKQTVPYDSVLVLKEVFLELVYLTDLRGSSDVFSTKEINSCRQIREMASVFFRKISENFQEIIAVLPLKEEGFFVVEGVLGNDYTHIITIYG